MSSAGFDLQGLFGKVPTHDIEPKDLDRMAQRYSRIRKGLLTTKPNRIRLAKLHWVDLQKLIAGMTDEERLEFLNEVAKR